MSIYIIVLEEGKAAHTMMVTEQEWNILSSLQLLTAKPVLYGCNVKVHHPIVAVFSQLNIHKKQKKEEEAAKGNSMVDAVKTHVAKYYSDLGDSTVPVVVVSAKLESEVFGNT